MIFQKFQLMKLLPLTSIIQYFLLNNMIFQNKLLIIILVILRINLHLIQIKNTLIYNLLVIILQIILNLINLKTLIKIKNRFILSNN